MDYGHDNSEVYRQIKAKFDEYTLPPRFLYAREPGSRAPYRIRLSVHPHKRDFRMLKLFRARGCNASIWTPKPVEQPTGFMQSTLYSVLCDLKRWIFGTNEDR